MTDTPKNIKDLQLRIWLSKPPMDRLLQFLTDNETLYTFWQQNINTLKNRATSGNGESNLTAEDLFHNDKGITG